MYKKIKDLDKALTNYQEAFSITEILNDHNGMASILYNIGCMKNKIGELPQALIDLSEAKKIMEIFKIKNKKLYSKIEKVIKITKRNIAGN